MAELSQAIAAVSLSISLVEHSEPPRLPINQLIEQDEVPELVDVSSLLQLQSELPSNTSAPPNPPLVNHSELPSRTVESQVDQPMPLLPKAVSNPPVDDSELPKPLHLIPLPEEQVFSSSPVDVSEPLVTMPEQRVYQSEPLVGAGEPPHPPESRVEELNVLLEDSGSVASNSEGMLEPAANSQNINDKQAVGGLEALTSLELELRLKRNNSTISRNKNHPKGNEHFREWSAKHDPDGIAWEYRNGEGKKKFHPLV